MGMNGAEVVAVLNREMMIPVILSMMTAGMVRNRACVCGTSARYMASSGGLGERIHDRAHGPAGGLTFVDEAA